MENVLLVGTPNSGKTTLFNWLTGRNHRVVNYPGSTVDYSQGQGLEVFGSDLQFFDSPGVYSLKPKSLEEKVTLDLLLNSDLSFRAVVAVLDSTQIERQIPLVRQLQEVGTPVVVALTMQDMYSMDQKCLPVEELEKQLGLPVVAVDGLLGKGVDQVAARLKQLEASSKPTSFSAWSVDRYHSVLAGARELVGGLISHDVSTRNQTEKWDSWLLHPVFGMLFFLSVMTLLFSSIFWAAAPLMDLVDQGFSFLMGLSEQLIGAGLFRDFVSEGVIASLGAVMIFVPQIFILFLGISILEESGYLARAAAIMDRPLSWVGMTGQSFVPLLSGFACAVPAVMAARSIKSPVGRWLTVLIIPFMTCSARLPVYALLISFLFLGKSVFWAGLLMTAMYLGGVIVSALTSALLSRLMPKKADETFAMELPLYRKPRVRRALFHSVNRTKSYISRAAPLIFVFALMVWVMSSFPNYQLEEPERTQTSFLSQAGQVLEPVFSPMGADWRVGVGMLSAFAAREVFVSTLAVVMNISEVEDEDAIQGSLIKSMQNAERQPGVSLFTPASVAALLVFFMLALQCMSTVGVVIREMGSWTYGLGQMVFMNVLAYGAAVVVFQVLKAMGFDA